MNKFAKTSIMISLGIGSCCAVLAVEDDMPRTRAEVIAERDTALASGWIAAMTGEDSGAFYLAQQRWVSTRTRADVTADVRAARRSGELAAMNGEDSGSAYLARLQPATVLARTRVLEELRQARASGELTAMVGEDSGSSFLSRIATGRTVRYAGPSPRSEESQPIQVATATGAR